MDLIRTIDFHQRDHQKLLDCITCQPMIHREEKEKVGKASYVGSSSSSARDPNMRHLADFDSSCKTSRSDAISDDDLMRSDLMPLVQSRVIIKKEDLVDSICDIKRLD